MNSRAGAATLAAPRVRVASAGTGKTTSLVVRYLELIDGGAPLRRIAGATFTRAAAAELRQRVGDGIGQVLAEGAYLGGLFTASAGSEARFEAAAAELDGALLTTIHGFMRAALRLNAPRLGLDPSFTAIAEWEADALFEVELTSLLLLAREPSHPLAEAAAFLGNEAVEKAQRLFRKRSLAPQLEFGEGPEARALGQIYRAALAAFERRLGGSGLAPGEVERRALQMLQVGEARRRLAGRFQRVLVDEYQDVNPMQGRFFELLAEAGVALELVGDPKQSIYGFRNADVTVFRRALGRAEAAGTVQPTLAESRRNSRAVLAFLNRLTDHLAAGGLGFTASEAPLVTGAGAQGEKEGAVELHIVNGERPLAQVRLREAELLVERLAAHHEAGVPYDRMAVLARSYSGLAQVERAAAAQGVPAILGQGRGYYERPEIRDVHHALSVGVDPAGPSLAPFLRGPFAALEPAEVMEVMSRAPAERPAFVAAAYPGVAARLEWLAELARSSPLTALKRLLREEVVDGRRFPELVGRRARENLDALVFDVAASPPQDLSLLLDRLEVLARKADAGDVPQTGAGVRLLTVHAAKGLEFDVTALFDTGGAGRTSVDPVLVEAEGGFVRLRGSEGYREAAAAERERQRQESWRLLYVAASRARDVLIITGSIGSSGVRGWLAQLQKLGLAERAPLRNVTVETHDYVAPRPAPPVPSRVRAPLEPAPYLGQATSGASLPPVTSPTRLMAGLNGGDQADAPAPAEGDEPLPPALRVASERELERGLVGWGRARGTLVHYAIGQNWHPDDPSTLATLQAQEVLFPFDDEQRAELLGEVLELLGAYQALLGNGLPPLDARSDDRAELPLVVRRGELVWEGIIDRLYRVGEEWFVDDYKTDVRVAPERYHVQLGLYLQALEGSLGRRPRGRLVFLRAGQVIEPPHEALERAVQEALSRGE